jgi:hypothetical protein
LLVHQISFYLRHLVVKILIYIYMFIFSTPVFIKHLWQLKTVVFLHRCLLHVVLLQHVSSNRPKCSVFAEMCWSLSKFLFLHQNFNNSWSSFFLNFCRHNAGIVDTLDQCFKTFFEHPFSLWVMSYSDILHFNIIQVSNINMIDLFLVD